MSKNPVICWSLSEKRLQQRNTEMDLKRNFVAVSVSSYIEVYNSAMLFMFPECPLCFHDFGKISRALLET